MLKGAQKRMIIVRTGDSRYFDEAYFVLKNDSSSLDVKTHSLAEEADRIISESCILFTKKRKKSRALGRAAFFSLGAGFASAVIGIVSLIIGIA